MLGQMDEFNLEAANHYSAYRPPIHSNILNQCLVSKSFDLALDVGCGVGNSSVALTAFSNKVIGIDNSEYMLQNTISNDQVSYFSESLRLDFNYDLLSFFGSLSYLDQASIEQYTNNVKPGGTIICCDFKVLYQPVLSYFKLKQNNTTYNHKKNLCDYQIERVELVEEVSFNTSFNSNSNQLAHLILSEFGVADQIKNILDSKEPHNSLVEILLEISPSNEFVLTTECYYSRYQKS